jgi:hypothetical protein
VELQVRIDERDVQRIARAVARHLQAPDRPQVSAWSAGAVEDLQAQVSGRVVEVLGSGPASRRKLAQSLSNLRRQHLDAALQGLSEAGRIEQEAGRWSLRQ